MIVRTNLSARIVWALSWRAVVYFVVLAILVPLIVTVGEWHELAIPGSIIGPFGTALAIFLAFRNSSAYDRWWEARKLWGALVNASRSFARQVMTSVADAGLARTLVRRQVAYAHALRVNLRRLPADELRTVLERFVDDGAERSRILGARHATTTILQLQSEALAAARKASTVEPLQQIELERVLTAITDVQGGCERIKNTPLPRPYDFYPRIFVYVYTFFIPFSVVEAAGWLTGVITVPVSFLFFALSRLGRTTEDPFENRFSDTPMDALCRTIEISLLEQAGEPDLPRPLEPVDGHLM